jgi:hypothetical protein
MRQKGAARANEFDAKHSKAKYDELLKLKRDVEQLSRRLDVARRLQSKTTK